MLKTVCIFVAFVTENLKLSDDREDFLPVRGSSESDCQPSRMGVPAWAQSSNISSSTSQVRKFPVHKLEESPVIANYIENTPELSDGRAPMPGSASPGETVWKVRREYTSKNNQVSSQSYQTFSK